MIVLIKAGKIFYTLLYLFLCLGVVFPQQWNAYTKENSGLVDNRIRSIVIDKKGVKWIGTLSGLCIFDDIEWTTFTTDDSLANDQVNDIRIENTNSSETLWIGTNFGVSSLKIEEFLKFDAPIRTNNSELVSDLIQAIAVDQYQVKWFGTDDGLSAFNGQDWRTFTTADELSHNNVKSIGFSQDGWKYIGTDGGGVTRLYSEDIDAVTSASPIEATWSGLLSDTVSAVFVDSFGLQWFATPAGVSSHSGDNSKENWNVYTMEDGLVDNFVQVIAQDQEGNMWFGTRGGVSSFNGSDWKSFTVENGLNDNIVHDIAIDLDNSVWFATDSGLSRYSNTPTSIKPITTPENFNTISIRTYPNPFNSYAIIEVYLGIDSFISINIYNVLGQEVRAFNPGGKKSGRFIIRWDGLDDDGHSVPSGIYIAQVTDGVNSALTKSIIVK